MQVRARRGAAARREGAQTTIAGEDAALRAIAARPSARHAEGRGAPDRHDAWRLGTLRASARAHGLRARETCASARAPSKVTVGSSPASPTTAVAARRSFASGVAQFIRSLSMRDASFPRAPVSKQRGHANQARSRTSKARSRARLRPRGVHPPRVHVCRRSGAVCNPRVSHRPLRGLVSILRLAAIRARLACPRRCLPRPRPCLRRPRR